ncbi:protein Star [Coccinella septempunctata]|uniref:protein Star n=1 Tax=Coccinella septempunctata TaxID=41139 RepID=UPI001D069ED7|nr:protein Star [Coccinella septempunctata]
MKNQNHPVEAPPLESPASNPSNYDASKDTPVKETTQSSPGLVKPLATFFMAFATVMTVLIVYMDNTAMKHYQFRMNLSQDFDFLSVTQDNPQLVTYIKEVFLGPAVEPHHKPLEYLAEEPSEEIVFVLKLLNNKVNGYFVEAGAYNDGKTSKTEWLEKKLLWKGLLIQPDPRHFFNLRRHNRLRSQAAHACLSPMPYPKEVTLHHDHDGVRINTALSNNLIGEPEWFNTRVKCFPLYSLLLAVNTTTVDYFSLESPGTELQILETIPFDQVNIKIISVHLEMDQMKMKVIKQFLKMKNYSLMKRFNDSYIYQIQ